jgi:hypothetical protein
MPGISRRLGGEVTVRAHAHGVYVLLARCGSQSARERKCIGESDTLVATSRHPVGYRFQEGVVPSGFGTIDDYINLVMYYSSVLRVPHYKKRSHHHYRRQDKKPLKEPNRRIGDGMQTPRGDGHASQCFARKKSSRLIQSPPRITHRFLTQRLSCEPYNYVALKTSRQIPI